MSHTPARSRPACVKTTMPGRRPLHRQCLSCKASSALKNAMLGGIERLGFASPSRPSRPGRGCAAGGVLSHSVVRNCSTISRAPALSTGAGWLIRLFYAGRCIRPRASTSLSARWPLETASSFTSIYGRGEQEEALRAEFGALRWVTLVGLDVWAGEPSRQRAALRPRCGQNYSRSVPVAALGTPVIGSNTGGIPSRPDGETDFVTPGDVDAWTAAFADAFSDRVRLTQTWRD